MKIFKNNFINNVLIALFAQLISLTASLVLTFVAPKLISVENYAYWQLFLFYVTYVNITRFGLIDGIYLRLGGKKYEELDHKNLSLEWLIFVIFQIILAIILFIFIILSNMNIDRKFVFSCCCFCIVLVNSNNYLSYILQAVNQTKRYSISLILQNIPWFIAVILLLITQIYSYKIIVIMYILGHILAGLYLSRHTKKIWQVNIKYITKQNINKVIIDIKENIKCGIFLMVSTYAGSLIIGSARIIIDNSFGVKVFGYFSFALVLANFILSFINQVSLVIFPEVKRLENNKQKDTYIFVRDLLSIILPSILILYLPICIFVKIWLPQYINSLQYLVYLLPICIFEGKVQLLYSTYFKALREEKLLLIINVITMIISSIIAFIFSYIYKNIYLVSLGILFVISSRSVVSSIIISKKLNIKNNYNIYIEYILVITFILLTLFLDPIISTIIYIVIYLIYVFINKRVVYNLISVIKKGK